MSLSEQQKWKFFDNALVQFAGFLVVAAVLFGLVRLVVALGG